MTPHSMAAIPGTGGEGILFRSLRGREIGRSALIPCNARTAEAAKTGLESTDSAAPPDVLRVRARMHGADEIQVVVEGSGPGIDASRR